MQINLNKLAQAIDLEIAKILDTGKVDQESIKELCRDIINNNYTDINPSLWKTMALLHAVLVTIENNKNEH